MTTISYLIPLSIFSQNKGGKLKENTIISGPLQENKEAIPTLYPKKSKSFLLILKAVDVKIGKLVSFPCASLLECRSSERLAI